MTPSASMLYVNAVNHKHWHKALVYVKDSIGLPYS